MSTGAMEYEHKQLSCRVAAVHAQVQACRHRSQQRSQAIVATKGDRRGSPMPAGMGRTYGERPAASQSQEPITAVSTQILYLLPKFQDSACRVQTVNFVSKLLQNREYTGTLQ